MLSHGDKKCMAKSSGVYVGHIIEYVRDTRYTPILIPLTSHRWRLHDIFFFATSVWSQSLSDKKYFRQWARIWKNQADCFDNHLEGSCASR